MLHPITRMPQWTARSAFGIEQDKDVLFNVAEVGRRLKLRFIYLNYMFNDIEKEELKRIINKYVEEGRCARPIHPDEVMQEVNRFKLTGGSVEEAESTEMEPALPSSKATARLPKPRSEVRQARGDSAL